MRIFHQMLSGWESVVGNEDTSARVKLVILIWTTKRLLSKAEHQAGNWEERHQRQRGMAAAYSPSWGRSCS